MGTLLANAPLSWVRMNSSGLSSGHNLGVGMNAMIAFEKLFEGASPMPGALIPQKNDRFSQMPKQISKKLNYLCRADILISLPHALMSRDPLCNQQPAGRAGESINFFFCFCDISVGRPTAGFGCNPSFLFSDKPDASGQQNLANSQLWRLPNENCGLMLINGWHEASVSPNIWVSIRSHTL